MNLPALFNQFYLTKVRLTSILRLQTGILHLTWNFWRTPPMSR